MAGAGPALRWPADYVTIIRPYRKGSHWGIDLGYGASTGPNLPILAAADGEVVAVVDGRKNDPAGGWGNRVQLSHGGGRYTLYAHLKSGSLLVKKGDRVKRGQQLAVMGNTGNSRGTHLHFELYEGGTSYTSPNYRVDPAPYLYVFPGQTVSAQNDYPEFIRYWKEEEETMTGEQYAAMYKDMILAAREQPQSAWAEKEGWWDRAAGAGIVDGTAPQNPLTRQEFITVLGRLGLIP